MQTLILVLITLLATVLLGRLAIHHAYRTPRVSEQESPQQWGLAYRTLRIPMVNSKRLHAWFIPPSADLALPFAHK